MSRRRASPERGRSPYKRSRSTCDTAGLSISTSAASAQHTQTWPNTAQGTAHLHLRSRSTTPSLGFVEPPSPDTRSEQRLPSPSIQNDAASERNIHALAHLTRINEEMVNFLHKQSQDPLETYQQLRKFCGSALAAEVLEEDFDMTDLTSGLLQPDSQSGTSRDCGNELPVKRAIREKLLLWKGRASKKENSGTIKDACTDTDTDMADI